MHLSTNTFQKLVIFFQSSLQKSTNTFFAAYSCVLNKRAGTLIFRWFNFPPAHTLLFSTCTIIGNYIHTYKANIANIQTARLFGPARLLGTQEYTALVFLQHSLQTSTNSNNICKLPTHTPHAIEVIKCQRSR